MNSTFDDALEAGIIQYSGYNFTNIFYFKISDGRFIAQVISHRVLPAEARVWAQVSLCGICGQYHSTVAL